MLVVRSRSMNFWYIFVHRYAVLPNGYRSLTRCTSQCQNVENRMKQLSKMVIVIRSGPVPPNNIVGGNRSRLVSSNKLFRASGICTRCMRRNGSVW